MTHYSAYLPKGTWIESARNVILTKTLKAELKTMDGTWKFNILYNCNDDDVYDNVNGNFKWIGILVPTINHTIQRQLPGAPYGTWSESARNITIEYSLTAELRRVDGTWQPVKLSSYNISDKFENSNGQFRRYA